MSQSNLMIVIQIKCRWRRGKLGRRATIEYALPNTPEFRKMQIWGYTPYLQPRIWGVKRALVSETARMLEKGERI